LHLLHPVPYAHTYSHIQHSVIQYHVSKQEAKLPDVKHSFSLICQLFSSTNRNIGYKKCPTLLKTSLHKQPKNRSVIPVDYEQRRAQDTKIRSCLEASLHLTFPIFLFLTQTCTDVSSTSFSTFRTIGRFTEIRK
jgi:hypothetical protein